MGMDKYSQDEDTLLQNLLKEEASLMQEVSLLYGTQEKTASEADRLRQAESRLGEVRAKISEIDPKNKG